MNIYFEWGHRGESEAGEWQFWTVGDDVDNATFRTRGDPADRVEAMLGDPLYSPHYVACVKGGLRRATPKEVAAWLLDHPHDSPYAVAPPEVRTYIEGVAC